jgi:phosphopantothenoylcysteine decarboxylase/phosphopantothenate--cysteine ligase
LRGDREKDTQETGNGVGRGGGQYRPLFARNGDRDVNQPSEFSHQSSVFSIQLKETADIAKSLGESKKAGQVIVGFALETEHEKENALRKLERKHMDAIVLNSLRDSGAGFGVDTNRVTILQSSGHSVELPLQSKADIANKIVELMLI